MNPPVPDADVIHFPMPSAEEAKELDEALMTAVGYTRGIVLDSRTVGSATGTGVVIGIGDRLFVASAKHCIEHNPFIIPRNKNYPCPCEPSKFIRRGLSPNRDIGYLEIENRSDVPSLPLECLCTDRPIISTDPDKPKLEDWCIVGFPQDESFTTLGLNVMKLTNYGTYPVEATDDLYKFVWPDCVARYQSPTDLVKRELNTTPIGYSGGGVWVFNHGLPAKPDEVIWAKHRLRMYAIESSWMKEERLVNCIPIKWWLKLVHDSYPNLQELLKNQFPFLRGD